MLILLINILTVSCTGKNEIASNITWPAKRVADIEGDIILGGLMMVHERQDNITCGPIMPQGGIQALEVMLYTLDEINPDLKESAGFTLGAHILDDCDNDTYGLEQAVAFIKGLFVVNYCRYFLFCFGR